MAGSPKWKVYDREGAYQASCKEIEGAAALMSFYGQGATIRADHRAASIVWKEGVTGFAAESYDTVAVTAVRAEAEWWHSQGFRKKSPAAPGGAE